MLVQGEVGGRWYGAGAGSGREDFEGQCWDDAAEARAARSAEVDLHFEGNVRDEQCARRIAHDVQPPEKKRERWWSVFWLQYMYASMAPLSYFSVYYP